MLTTLSFDECPDCEFAQDVARCRPSRQRCEAFCFRKNWGYFWVAEVARLLEAGLIQPNSHESSYEHPSQCRRLAPAKYVRWPSFGDVLPPTVCRVED